MAKWKVSVSWWETEVEADDEGDALLYADMEFNFQSEARAEDITDGDEEE